MIRYLNVLSVAALVGPAIFAYSIKYETMRYSAEIVKLQHSIEREYDRMGMLRAEWAYLTRPCRIQALADRHLDMQWVSVDQIVTATDLPERAVRIDAIGRKLELLGLAEPTATPNDKRAGATTPSSSR